MSALHCILQQTLPSRMLGYLVPAVKFNGAARLFAFRSTLLPLLHIQ